MPFTLTSIVVAFTVFANSGQPAAVDASALTFGAASQVAELDMSRLKGEPTRLAWSPDGSQFYVQTSEYKTDRTRTDRHYVVSASGVKPAEGMPEWASKYWAWKSQQASPGAPGFKIEVTGPETRTVRATAAPMGGDYARGGTGGGTEGTTIAEATSVAQQSQSVSVITIRLKGEVVGEFVNGPLVPGLTFGWAPPALPVIAYTSKDGKVLVMDEQGRKKEVADTAAASLPAWSDDGAKLAYLKKDGRRTYKLFVRGVSR
jgi:hypothetical protein